MQKTTKCIKDCFHCLKSSHVKNIAKFPTKIKGKNKPKYEKKAKRCGEKYPEKDAIIKLTSTIVLNI